MLAWFLWVYVEAVVAKRGVCVLWNNEARCVCQLIIHGFGVRGVFGNVKIVVFKDFLWGNAAFKLTCNMASSGTETRILTIRDLSGL